MHPYKMQRLIKDRGKDQVINVEQRASLYQTMNQLLRAGLIAEWETARDEGFPERTVYRLTDKGHAAAREWMHDMLATPGQEYPEFPAAISLLPLLTPQDALAQLERREIQLVKQIAALDVELEASGNGLPRLFVLESEYMRVVQQTELEWVRALCADIQSGEINWNLDWSKPGSAPNTENE